MDDTGGRELTLRDELEAIRQELAQVELVIDTLARRLGEWRSYTEEFRQWITGGLLTADRGLDMEDERIAGLRTRLAGLCRRLERGEDAAR